MRKLFLAALLSITIMACKKSSTELEKDDYIIFGHFYGMCLGEECVERFMLTDSKLYEDIADSHNDEIDPEYVELDDSFFDDVVDIEDEIPAELLSQPDSTFGCPDCHDQGGVYFELKRDGETSRWRIDNDLDAIPVYLQDFVTEIKEKINLINE